MTPPVNPTMDDLNQPQDPPTDPPVEEPPVEPEEPPKEPPKEPSPADLTVDELKALTRQQAETIRGLAGQNDILRERFDALNSKIDSLTAPPPPSAEEQTKKYFEDPVTGTRKIVKEELETSIKPLKDFVGRFEATSKYDQVKAKVRADPKFKAVFEAAEDMIDAAMAEQQPTEQVLRAVAMSVAGSISMGLIEGRTLGKPTPPPPPNGDPNVSTPSHIRPSAPPAPVPPKKQEPKLTELERRLARERNLTPEQYVALRDMRPDEVATTKVADIGKEK